MAGKKRSKSDAKRPPPISPGRKRSSSDVPPPISPLLPRSPVVSRRIIKEAVLEEPSKSPEEWIEFALKTIQQCDHTIDAVRFLARQHESDMLEFLMTANQTIRDEVCHAVCLAWFPNERAAWPSSLSSTLLDRFRHYFNRLPPHLVDRQVTNTCRSIPSYVAALEALDHISFEAPPRNSEEEESEEKEYPFFVKRQTQRERKSSDARARANTITVDPRIFITINYDVPTSPDSLGVMEDCLLGELRRLLETLVYSFANPELADHAKALAFKIPLQYIQAKPSSSSVRLPSDNDASNSNLNNEVSEPDTHPEIRPLGAVKYFDNSNEMGKWTIALSGRAIADLKQLRREEDSDFAVVQKKIRQLSRGLFSESNHKILAGLDMAVPIYEAEISQSQCIVYQIDIHTDVYAGGSVEQRLISRSLKYSEFIIMGKWTVASGLWSLITSQIAEARNTSSNAYIFKHKETKRPLSLSKSAPETTSMTDEERLKLHSLVALEKYIPMSQDLLRAIMNDSDANHVFLVSPKEQEIIYHKSACLVLGRSGTGKTTSMVFKMIGIEKLFEQLEEVTKPRQVFITQSRVLAQRVREYYRNIMSASPTTSSGEKKQGEEEVLADADDEDAAAFGLPAKYSLLEDEHFPLFLTYDQLCSLLEADLGLHFGRLTRGKAYSAVKRIGSTNPKVDPSSRNRSSRPTRIDAREERERAKRSMITFDIFVSAYWPHFDQRLTKGMDPALVYSEFLGIIEGSEAALDSKTGALSRESYRTHRKSSLAVEPDHVYDLYEIYRKRKRDNGGCDAAERTHALLKEMNGIVPGPKLDCLYVDEAQDNLLIDMRLLRHLSNNPHGVFVAGDTAQTISAGSAFRFEDLRAFLWRLEEKDEAVTCGKRSAIHPTLFHLAVNYRSHGGIIDCASSIVQLISDLFPRSIDKLDKESGMTEGPKPVFFSGWGRDVVQFEQFLRGKNERKKIDFGADQAILVRNEAARESLKSQLGNVGIILTLYESKGLEFNDVLLYNFFEDSTPTYSTWRVILHGLQGDSMGPLPQFDETRHAVICTELKNLYVGLTRARNNCWIWDMSEKAEPMKIFWHEQDLVTLCGPNDPIPDLIALSSKSEWANSGRLMFNKQLYSQAMLCFERAGMPLERKIASAYQARQEARLLLAKRTDRQTLRYSFLNAAETFVDCATKSKGKQRRSCYIQAAECYQQAEKWEEAAEIFLSIRDFDSAAKDFRRAGCFDKAISVIKQNEDRIQKELADEIIAVARLEYLRKSQYDNPRQAAELFDDVNEQLDYMDDFGFDSGSIHVLKLQKRYGDAAEVALKEHDLLGCIELLALSNETVHHRQAIAHALRGLWLALPYGSDRTQTNNSTIKSLLEHLERSLTAMNEDEKRQARRQPEALLCFSHCYRNLSDLKDVNPSTFVSNSALVLAYFSNLSALLRAFKPSLVKAQQLLGFATTEVQTAQNLSEDEPPTISEFRLFSSSLMFRDIQSTIGDIELTPFALGLTTITVSESYLTRFARQTLFTKLETEMQEMRAVASNVRSIQPCLDFAVFGNCLYETCGRHKLNSFKVSDEDRQGEIKARRSWLKRTYEVLLPHFSPLGNFWCADSRRVWELGRGFGVISNWCRNYLHELSPNHSSLPLWEWFLSNVLVCLELASRVQPQHFYTYGPRLHSMKLTRWHPDLMVHMPGPFGPNWYSIVHYFIDFYLGRTGDTLNRVILAVHRVIFKPLPIEANILVNVLESIGRELIVQLRMRSMGASVFNGLLFPQSWALDLVSRHPRPRQDTSQMWSFFNILYRSLDYIRIYEYGTGNTPLLRKPTVMNIPPNIHTQNSVLTTMTHCLNGPVSVVDGNVLAEDQLVCTFHRSRSTPRVNPRVKVISYNEVKPDLERLLSLTGDLNQAQTATLNPEAMPFVQTQPKAGPSSSNADTKLKDMGAESTNTPDGSSESAKQDIPTALISTQTDDPTVIPQTQDSRILAAQEIEAGKQILFCYRRYMFRQRIRAWFAVRTIWRCYSRYQDRARIPRDQIRQLYHEYKKAVDGIECPLFDPKTFRRHEHILLGPMPHVMLYLRGLERVIQNQKTVYKKQLQKVQHEDLERLQDGMNACRYVFRVIDYESEATIDPNVKLSGLTKTYKALYPRISPGQPEPNGLQKIETLQSMVQEVDSLRASIIEALGEDAISGDVEEHYQLGVHAILAPSADPAPKD
ncbi:P-loop nucleoside triphosphate hydrolase [Ceratobasidium sp. AG-Ba]|nr:P-loop nucleoside triphosphate hydrolase [Ceratobasidium sp. AG-Ba]